MKLSLAYEILKVVDDRDALNAIYFREHHAKPGHNVMGEWIALAMEMCDDDSPFNDMEKEKIAEAIFNGKVEA